MLLKREKRRSCVDAFYAEAIRRNLCLERITAAIKDLDNVELNLASRIREKELLEQVLDNLT
jgi:hypothetical protein